MRFTIVGLWSIALCWYGLTGPLYRTEALRAIIAQEALSGNWLVPTLYGEPFLTKPPGVYVAIAAVSSFVGEVTEVSARVPSALAATFVLIFCYTTFRRIVSDNQALVIVLLVPVSVLWLEKVPSAEIDMLQLAWVTVAILCFIRAELLTNNHRWINACWWFAALGCVAGGFLTKWTAPAFFYLTIIPYAVWSRRWRMLFCWPHLLGLILAITICSLWAIAVVQAVGWDVLGDTVGREAAQRFVPKHVGKPYPWLESLTFPFVLFAANLPWSIGALLGMRRRYWGDAHPTNSLVRLLHCWLWPNILFWSLPAQHNVRYVLPIAPAFVILSLIVMFRHLQDAPRWLWVAHQPRRWLAATLIIWLVVKIGYVEAIMPKRTANRNAESTGQQIANLVPVGETLYLCKLKDEGVLFYYARTARRFELSRMINEPIYALLLESELAELQRVAQLDTIAKLYDQQQAPIYLVRIVSKSCPSPMAFNQSASVR